MLWTAVRSELRGTKIGLVALALVVAILTAGTALAATGARRTQTALPRLLESAKAHHVRVGVGLAGGGQGAPEPELLAALPEVEAVLDYEVSFVLPLDRDGVPVGGEHGQIATLVPTTEAFGRTVAVPRIHDGRIPAADKADEVAVNRPLAERLQVELGDEVPLVSLTPEQTETMFQGEDAGPPAGPSPTVRVVGIITHYFEAGEGDVPDYLMTLSPAFNARYGDEIGGIGRQTFYRLHGGEAGLASFVRSVREALGDPPELFVETTSDATGRLDEASRVQAFALGLFAIVLAVAALVIAGAAASRQAEARGPTARALHALGATRTEAASVAVTPVAVGIGAGVLVGLVAAVLASPLTPPGSARTTEPSPGIDVHLPLLAATGALVFVGVVALAALGARRGLRNPTTRERERPFALAVQTARIGAPPPVVVGMGLLGESERTRGAGTRTLLGGAAVAVAALTAALVVGTSMGHLLDTPRLYGWTPTFIVEANEPEQTADQLEEMEGVDAVAVARTFFADVEGESVQFLASDTSTASLFPTIAAGRAPANRDEVAFGSRTLDALGVEIGDRVRISGERSATFLIVGQAVTVGMDANLAGAGGVLSTAGAELLDIPLEAGIQGVLVKTAEGAEAATVARAGSEGMSVVEPVPQADVGNFKHVKDMPLLLAAVLGLVAVGVLVHGLLVGTRRRAADLAILRALGFRKRQVAVTLSVQAIALVAFACAVAIPIGVLVGRWVWRGAATSTGVAVESRAPAAAMLAIVGAAFVLANLAAAWPAWRATHESAAEILARE